MEITRIQTLAEKAQSEEERKWILDTIDVFSDTFNAMLHGTRAYMLEGTANEKADLSAATEALRFLRKCGAQYSMDFPEANTDRDVAAYVIKIATEVIHQR